MAKGQIYAVDELIASIIKMSWKADGIEKKDIPFHVDYSKLNPTFTLHDQEEVQEEVQ